MFLIGVPIAFVAFLLSWTLPEVPLRRAIRDSEPAENLGPRSPRNSLDEVQRLLERAVNRENRRELYGMLAERADLDLQPRACWLLYRVADKPDATVEEVSAKLLVDPERLREGVDELEAAGMIACVERPEGRRLEITDAGSDAIARLTTARRDSLSELLEGWNPGEHPEVVAMIHELARVLMADDDRLLADARAT
jgi:DNA-binding MarR family transcriptional regulator